MLFDMIKYFLIISIYITCYSYNLIDIDDFEAKKYFFYTQMSLFQIKEDSSQIKENILNLLKYYIVIPSINYQKVLYESIRCLITFIILIFLLIYPLSYWLCWYFRVLIFLLPQALLEPMCH